MSASMDFRSRLATVSNPYGSGGASAAIVELVGNLPLEGVLEKSFFDLPRMGSPGTDQGPA